jgi:ribonucleoside-diphosphate reductase alpha chain
MKQRELTNFSIETLKDRYMIEGETPEDMFRRVSKAFSDDDKHAERLYNYMSSLWFLPASPVLMNGGTDRGLPISCYLNSVEDSREGIFKTWIESCWLGSEGGGVGTNWSNLRAIGEMVHGKGTSSGIIPFMKVQDSMTLAINQGSLRRGAAAVYLHISHPEIEEFISIRKPTGGDKNRKCLKLHTGVIIPDEFMEAAMLGKEYVLKDPHSKKPKKVVKAEELYQKILEMRIETGESYIVYEDNAQKGFSSHQKQLGMKVSQSNLCSEIMLHTGLDHLGKNRTAVCCLSSLNVEYYDEWCRDELFIEDVIRFLDNVLQSFIDKAKDYPGFEDAVYSATRERSIGLGVMGLQSWYQKNNLAFESFLAKTWNLNIFKDVREKADKANYKLALEKGSCPDAQEVGALARCSHLLAVAPTASISIIANTSPCIEPWNANIFTQKTLSGFFTVKNKYLDTLFHKKALEKVVPDSSFVGDNSLEIVKQVQEIVTNWWDKVLEAGGSVQDFDEEVLSAEDKMVFRTAFEVDQRAIVNQAGDRTPFIDQGQSLNLFLPSDTDKRDLLALHVSAWKKGVKSLYYCRSKSLQRAGTAGNLDYEECLSCQ